MRGFLPLSRDAARRADRTLLDWFVVGIVTLPFALILSAVTPDWLPRPIAVVLLLVLGGAFVRFVGFAMFRGAMQLLGPILAPTGHGTPYVHDFSQEQALVARGDVATALALYEQRIAAAPDDVEARIRAADTYAREARDPGRAAALFREVVRMPGVRAERHVYAVHRLADLHGGPLGDPRPALRELARLADLYPGTDVAREARRAIGALKARIELASD